MSVVQEASILLEPFERAQRDVDLTLRRIMSAAGSRAVDELESFHAFGAKFTKFDDFAPLDRQDAETARQLERDALTGVQRFAPAVLDLKVDVFGPVAVATFVMEYEVVTEEGQELAFRARSTMVFAHDRDRWLIVHEHFSPFTENG